MASHAKHIKAMAQQYQLLKGHLPQIAGICGKNILVQLLDAHVAAFFQKWDDTITSEKMSQLLGKWEYTCSHGQLDV
ncbi:hypothetical protein LTS10_004326 [Elasticomyces elasticus]|nr:hypothetical protein LTS10_004326 [Elasticomyces elasticus]